MNDNEIDTPKVINDDDDREKWVVAIFYRIDRAPDLRCSTLARECFKFKTVS